MTEFPPRSRRSFVTTAVSFSAAAPVLGHRSRSDQDPLGVRADFPVVDSQLYLDSAYIPPSPRQVTDAGRGFIESKAARPIPLGAMLEPLRSGSMKWSVGKDAWNG